MRILEGFKIISTATHLPGPIAASRLAELGAQVIKIEPKFGDIMKKFFPDWYEELHTNIQVVNLDLKDTSDQNQIQKLLVGAHILLTSQKPKSLEAMGLGWKDLTIKFRQLSHVGVVGYPQPNENQPGHDINFQGLAGTVSPPLLPLTLVADIYGAERIVRRCIENILLDSRGQPGRQTWVSLAETVKEMDMALRNGATTKKGILGGGLPTYGFYKTKKDWVAIAALEPHFEESLCEFLKVKKLTRGHLTKMFGKKTAADWEKWAREKGLPISRVVKL